MKQLICAVLLAAAMAAPAEEAPETIDDLGFKKLKPSRAEQKALDAAKGKVRGWVAWQSLRDNNWNIYSMRADGTEVRRLTDHPLDDENPCWAPDGALIAFDTRRSGRWQIFTMRPDGSDQKLLIDNARRPAWSADGQHIVLERDWKIFLFTLADRTERELVPGTVEKALLAPFKPDDAPRPVEPTMPPKTIKAHQPAISTDGKMLAFTTDVRFPWEVAVLPLDGKTITLLAWGREPAWLPGTDEVVFTKEAGRGGTDLWIRAATGGQPSLGSSLDMPWGYEYTPAVSPDGTWLVWAASAQHDPFAANYELLIRKLDDPKAQPLRLTFHTAPDRCPSLFVESEAE